MNDSVDRSSNIRFDDPGYEERASRTLVVVITALIAIALTLAAWLIVTTGSADVAAAPPADQVPRVPYFPSQYVNQADAPSPAPPTF